MPVWETPGWNTNTPPQCRLSGGGGTGETVRRRKLNQMKFQSNCCEAMLGKYAAC
ncbi:MAG: hypothetical protein ACLSFT_08910 [Ruminococcus callidus]